MKRAEEAEPAYRVVPNDPARRLRYWFIAVMIASGIGMSGYYLGGSWAWHRIRLMQESLARKQVLIQEQGLLVTRLQQQIAIVERARQINRDAVELVRRDVRRLETDNAQLNRDLAFFRSIIAPEEEDGVVSVHRLELWPTDQPRHFQWKLVVMQSAKRHQFIKGQLQVTVVGKQNDNPVSFDLHALSSQLNNEKIRLGFRYFQSIPGDGIRGDITLPEGFTPEYLQVTGHITNPKEQDINRKFNWTVEGACQHVGKITIHEEVRKYDQRRSTKQGYHYIDFAWH